MYICYMKKLLLLITIISFNISNAQVSKDFDELFTGIFNEYLKSIEFNETMFLYTDDDLETINVRYKDEYIDGWERAIVKEINASYEYYKDKHSGYTRIIIKFNDVDKIIPLTIKKEI